MSGPVNSVLVVGGGIGGMSAAIAFRSRGVPVDVIDIDPEWRVYGAGITITGPTLRAFHHLGVLDAIGREGYFFEQIKFFTEDGDLLQVMETPVLEAGVPAGGGILRPALHRILSERTIADGAKVRLGVTLEDFTDTADGVEARFSDGTSKVYDIIVGADGANSRLRERLFPEAPKLVFTGQGCWRLLADRAPDVTCAQVYFGRNKVKVGISPCAPDKVYMFATLAMPGNPFIADADLVDGMRRILASFGGHVRAIHDAMGPYSSVNYRPLFSMIVPEPWSRGRVGLIGDAVHATTPHLASGAGISVEDGLVLAEEMARAPSAEAGWTAFTKRRFERARLVVDNSLEISRIEQADDGAETEIRRLMRDGAFALAQPI